MKRLYYITFGMFGFCRRWGHRFGYVPAYASTADAEGWFLIPYKRREGRICKACAYYETKDT